MRIPTLQEKLGVTKPSTAIDFINLLVYGDPGVGKTYLCGSAQDHEDTRPILFLDVEGGVVTLRHRDDIDVKSVRSVQEISEVYQELFKLGKEKMHYKTVIIDSLTELQKLDMRQIMKAAKAKDDSRDEEVPSPREWGICGQHISTIVRAYRDLPCNVIFTAQEQQDKDKEGNVRKIYPDLPGKLKTHVAGFVDIVGYLRVDTLGSKQTRRMQLASTSKVTAKDRSGTLGDILDNPSVPIIWEKIHG